MKSVDVNVGLYSYCAALGLLLRPLAPVGYQIRRFDGDMRSERTNTKQLLLARTGAPGLDVV